MIDELSDTFERLSQFSFKNYNAMNVMNYNCCSTSLFDFSNFFRHYLVLKCTNSWSITNGLQLIINNDHYSETDTDLDELKEKIDNNLKGLVVENDEQYFKLINEATLFMRDYDNFMEKVFTENKDIHYMKAILKAYCINETRKYLTCEEGIRYELVDLYGKFGEEYANKLLNSIIDFSSRNNLNYKCNFALLEKCGLYTVIEADKNLFHFEIIPFTDIDIKEIKLIYNKVKIEFKVIDGIIRSDDYNIVQLLYTNNTISFDNKDIVPIGKRSKYLYSSVKSMKI